MQKNQEAEMAFLRETQRAVFMSHINRISKPLDDPMELERFWEQGVIRRFENFYFDKLKSNISLIKSKSLHAEFAAGFLYNMFDCPSHSQSLKTVFKLLHHGQFQKDQTIQEYLNCLYHSLEILSRNDTLEPYRKVESFSQKVVRYLQKKLNW